MVLLRSSHSAADDLAHRQTSELAPGDGEAGCPEGLHAYRSITQRFWQADDVAERSSADEVAGARSAAGARPATEGEVTLL